MANALPVFVSRSQEDGAACQALVTALRGAGADVWYDEQNMGAGIPEETLQREVRRRGVFIILLSGNAFGSRQIRRETVLAYEQTYREPTRILLPITVAPIAQSDFDPGSSWLFLRDYRRIEAPGCQPYRLAETIERVLHLLALSPAADPSVPLEPQPDEGMDDLIARGKALQLQGRLSEALEFFVRALRRDSELGEAWLNLAFLDVRVNKFRALEAFDAALNRNEQPVAA